MRTDIAGFVGFAERGPLAEDSQPGFDASLAALRITSWAEYQAAYGAFLPAGYLAYSVRAFFENGGDTCYVVRVAATRAAIDRQPLAASFPLPAGTSQPAGALAGPGIGFTAKITLPSTISADKLVGHLIQVSHPGLNQEVIVLAELADGSFLLAAPLDARFAAGDAVALYPTAAIITARSRGAWGNRLRLAVHQRLDAGAFGLLLPSISGRKYCPPSRSSIAGSSLIRTRRMTPPRRWRRSPT